MTSVQMYIYLQEFCLFFILSTSSSSVLPSICATVRKGCPCAEGNGHCESLPTTLSLVRKTSLHRLCSHNHHVLRGVGPACRVRWFWKFRSTGFSLIRWHSVDWTCMLSVALRAWWYSEGCQLFWLGILKSNVPPASHEQMTTGMYATVASIQWLDCIWCSPSRREVLIATTIHHVLIVPGMCC